MRTITDIKKIGRGDRYYLYLDDQLFGVFEAEILAKSQLKTGQAYQDEFFDQLLIENGDYACFNRGLSVLEKGMKSEKMLKDYLYSKGYPKQCIERGVAKIKEYGYINDSSFCENYILSYINSKSMRKLKYDLLAKGIREEIVEESLNKFLNEEDEREKCMNFAKKYMKNRDFDLKNKQKFYNHLVSKGFDYSDISYCWDMISEQK